MRLRWIIVWEGLAVVVMLAVAAAIRLALASRGWPAVNSDESIMGLMADDVLWHGAHPVFFYGQHYMGALQSYEAIPVFLALGPTDFALHAATTLQFLLFLAALYGFTRTIYSPLVALGTLALLVSGAPDSLFLAMHAGVGAQDTLLFGAVLLWLVVLRLRHPQRRATKLALDIGIGLAAGLGFWADFLIVPFLCAAGLALSVEAMRRARTSSDPRRLRSLAGQALIVAGAAGIVLIPFLIVTVASRGATFTEVLSAAGAAGAADASRPQSLFLVLPRQSSAILLDSLPHVLGSGQLCQGCVLWPAPQSQATPAQVLRLALFSLPFSLVALACGLAAARPLARDVRQALRRASDQPVPEQALASASDVAPFDPRWWGRAMLVIGGALTLLEYALSRAAYEYPLSSARYLAGIYLCAPLFAAPLWQSSQQVWRWLRASARRPAALPRPHPLEHQSRNHMFVSGRGGGPGGMRGPSSRELTRQARGAGEYLPSVLAFLASGLLLIVLALNTLGSVTALRQAYIATPGWQRDLQALAFLEEHGATRFYTSYWTCYRLAFESEERVDCALISSASIFDTSGGRIPDYLKQVAAAPHPAYVFDTTGSDFNPSWPRQVVQEMARGNPKFAGYKQAIVAGFIIFYYAGSSSFSAARGSCGAVVV